jgi:hypothetical protein
MVTFPIDDVVPAAEPLRTQPLAESFPEALAVGGDPTLPVLAPDGVHPLLGAVARAFADHRPLVLSPDVVWLTITQGVAQHIRLHAEELRPQLVNHHGRKRLIVGIDGPLPGDADSWRYAVGVFRKLLAAEVADADLFECDFSTSTDVERVAAHIVMLDAYSPYFALWLVGICGIPSVTLTGTVEDWQKIRARVDALATFGLDTWRRSLALIADQFVRAASGDVDTAFWQRIYNPRDAYGGEVITGWAARFYPYLKQDDAMEEPNPLLDLPIDEPRDVTVDGRSFHGPAISSRKVPATLSRVVVNVNDRVAGDNRVVALHAGLVGIAQDGDGSLRPIAGWHVTPASVEIDDVIERIVRDHDITPPQPPRRNWDAYAGRPSPELVAVYRRIHSASLFDGAWRLLPAGEHLVTDRNYPYLDIETVIELADGRSIGAVSDHDSGTTHWVVCRVEELPPDNSLGIRVLPLRARLLDDPADVPVLGTSLAMILDAALDSGGDLANLQTAQLSELDAATIRAADARKAAVRTADAE